MTIRLSILAFAALAGCSEGAQRPQVTEAEVSWWQRAQADVTQCGADMDADNRPLVSCSVLVTQSIGFASGSKCAQHSANVEAYVAARTSGAHLYDLASRSYDGCITETQSFIEQNMNH